MRKKSAWTDSDTSYRYVVQGKASESEIKFSICGFYIRFVSLGLKVSTVRFL